MNWFRAAQVLPEDRPDARMVTAGALTLIQVLASDGEGRYWTTCRMKTRERDTWFWAGTVPPSRYIRWWSPITPPEDETAT